MSVQLCPRCGCRQGSPGWVLWAGDLVSWVRCGHGFHAARPVKP